MVQLLLLLIFNISAQINCSENLKKMMPTLSDLNAGAITVQEFYNLPMAPRIIMHISPLTKEDAHQIYTELNKYAEHMKNFIAQLPEEEKIYFKLANSIIESIQQLIKIKLNDENVIRSSIIYSNVTNFVNNIKGYFFEGVVAVFLKRKGFTNIKSDLKLGKLTADLYAERDGVAYYFEVKNIKPPEFQADENRSFYLKTIESLKGQVLKNLSYFREKNIKAKYVVIFNWRLDEGLVKELKKLGVDDVIYLRKKYKDDIGSYD